MEDEEIAPNVLVHTADPVAIDRKSICKYLCTVPMYLAQYPRLPFCGVIYRRTYNLFIYSLSLSTMYIQTGKKIWRNVQK